MALTNEQFERAVQLGTGMQSQGVTPARGAQGGFSLKETGQDFLDIGENVIDSFSTGWEEQKQAFGRGSRGEQTPMETGVQAATSGLQNYVFEPAGEAFMGALKMMSSQKKEEQTAESFGQILVSTGAADKINQYVEYKKTLSPRERANLEAGETVLEAAASFVGADKLFKTGKLAQGAVNSVSESAQKIGGKVVEMTPTNIRNTIRRAPEADQQKLRTDLEDSLRASFVDDKPAVQKALDRVAGRSGRDINGDELIARLANEGVVPKADGEVSDFGDFFKYVESEESRIGGTVTRRLKQENTPTSINEIRQQAREQIVNDPYVSNIAQAERAIDTLLDTFEKRYGPNLSPIQINEIRKTTNRTTGAFNKEDFDLDAAAAVGNVARTRIDTIVKSDSVKAANSRLAELYLLRDAAKALNRRKIDTGEVAKTLGSFMGTVAAGATGLAVAGPGGLVVAYLAARMGSQTLAKMIRNMRFGDKNREIIIRELRKDPATVRRLIKEADEGDREILERALLPAAGETSGDAAAIAVGPRTGQDTVKAVDAPKGEDIVTRGEGGRFQQSETFTQGEKRAVDKILLDTEARLNESSSKGTDLSKNKQGGFARFFGGKDNRVTQLEESITRVDNQIKKFENEGKSPKAAPFRRLLEARQKLEKEISKINRSK